ncbi:MAG: Txe/YoeB family addiction module toxin [Cyclobacteriaceae bacterium]|nr:Txe/YoeB family addiction module toxin [Cyclobacteriaceae bacterium]
MRNIEFVPKAFKEYQDWIQTDRRTALRIGDLIKDILRNPFEGLGKPEPLKHQFKGAWSRRIDQEHRLIYLVNDNTIVILSCYSHYN